MGIFGEGDQRFLKERVREEILSSTPTGSLPDLICFLQEKTDQQKQRIKTRGRRGEGVLGGGVSQIKRGEA